MKFIVAERILQSLSQFLDGFVLSVANDAAAAYQTTDAESRRPTSSTSHPHLPSSIRVLDIDCLETKN